MDYKKIDIFSPMIFVLIVVIYLLFSLIGFKYHLKELVGININTIYIIFLGLIFYVLGMIISKVLLKNRNLTLNDDRLTSLTSEKLILALVILGILLQVVNLIYLGGIPLFSGYLKAHAATRIWLLSYLLFLPSINVLIAKYPNKKAYVLLLIGLLLFISTGYRTTVMAIVISALITLYYTKKIPQKYLLIAIIGIFILLMVVGYVAVQSIEWQTWTLNPLELIFYRAGYTLQVLDKAVIMQGSTHGQLLYNTLTGFAKSTDPRVIVGSTTLGYAHSTTSTIFGPALLDYGLYAMLIELFIIGFILNTVYEIQKTFSNAFVGLYAILLAHILICIETGLTDLVIILFFIISLFVIVYTIKIKEVK